VLSKDKVDYLKNLGFNNALEEKLLNFSRLVLHSKRRAQARGRSMW